ncbi:MAG: hypothetical protein DCE90_13520 [Pseudanabaena sp.]|nr:MAG: hypothetical protein DCE90_13520 [Pseudanabaena sp.]
MPIFVKGYTLLIAASLTLMLSNSSYAQEISPNFEAESPQVNILSKSIDKSTRSPQRQQELDNQLLAAAKNGSLLKVRSLTFQSANVNVRDQDGWTPLLWAVMNSHTEVSRFLLASGANPNTRNKYGWTPLMWAAGQGDSEIVRSLIARGARLNAQDGNGWTAMMWAWDGNQQEAIAILKSVSNN